jgi:hypothetical protein
MGDYRLCPAYDLLNSRNFSQAKQLSVAEKDGNVLFQAIEQTVFKLRSAYTGLSLPTRNILQSEFRGGTENHIIRFEANVNQVI